MKTIANLKWLAAILLVAFSVQNLSAQTKANIFDDTTPITWLGLDYSQTKFIGTASNTSQGKGWNILATTDNGIVSNEQFRDEFTVQWNQLFIDEMKKYNVAKAVHRDNVKYALEVTAKANKGLNKDFFSNNPSDFKLINETNIATAVKKYDFQKNEGIGLIFFVEGMSKGMQSEGVWVTFVDMKSKTVLFTTYKTGKPQGFNFRNFWAKPLFTILKDITDDYKDWKKKA
jgi:hypothetical protein